MRASVSNQVRQISLRILEIVALLIKSLFQLLTPRSWRFKDVKGEIAVVTGAGSGLGRLLALDLARRQVIVALLDINDQGNTETHRLITEEGGTSYVFHCDVSNPEDVYVIAKKVKEQLGVVTILFNNAGILSGDNFMDLPDYKIRKTFEINAMGPIWACKAFLPDMMESNKGHVVNIASLGGLVAYPKLSDYCASKHAVVGFDECLKVELRLSGHTGVRTTLVCPSFFRSGLYQGLSKHPLQRQMSVDAVCETIMAAFLAEEQTVLIPGDAKILLLFKPWIPIEVGIRLMELIGFYDTVKHFKGGRLIQDTSKTEPVLIQNEQNIRGKIAVSG